MNQAEERQSSMVPLLKARIFAYDLLRRTFLAEPSREYLLAVCEHHLIEAFPFSQESEQIQAGMEEVAAFLNQDDDSSSDRYDLLCWDYTRLFIGPDKLPAPPWESAYLNDQKLLFQEETLKVREAYRKYGLLPKNFRQEADDHLGLELDFMFHLGERMLAEADSAIESARMAELIADSAAFLQQHLLQWVGALTDDIGMSANTGFYRGMAKILVGFLELDLEALQELNDYGCFQN